MTAPTKPDLLDARAVRARAHVVLEGALANELPWWRVQTHALAPLAEQLAGRIGRHFPSLNVPLHSRWRHIEAGGVARLEPWLARTPYATDQARTAALLDFAFVSVLLDAGAGAAWQYHEAATAQRFSRSEGLALASWYGFVAGAFGTDDNGLPCVDGHHLANMSSATLSEMFQVRQDNPLLGLEQRAALMRSLGSQLVAWSAPSLSAARPSAVVQAYLASQDQPDANGLLRALLQALNPIWPHGQFYRHTALGDCWQLPWLSAHGLADGWVPFHKLTQWLCYSLQEPLAWGRQPVTGWDVLTALPEYRNGGLLIDAGVIEPRQANALAAAYTPDQEEVVSWRALTVALMDRLWPMVCDALRCTPDTLSLSAMLEGGTWLMGRELAYARRGGEPPLRLVSDGTVF